MDDGSSSEEKNEAFVENLIFAASNKNMVRDLLKDIINEVVDKKHKKIV